MLLFGRREFLAHQAAVIHAGLQLVEQLDGLLFGHIEGDAVLLRHLLELLGGHALQPLGGRDLCHLGGEQLGLFEFRLLQPEQIDQFFLGPQQADLVFLELGAECRSGQVAVIDPRFGQIEQLDEIGLGPGNGHAVLFRQGLELFDRQRTEVGDVAVFKGALELGVLLGLGVGHAFQHMGRENAGVPLRCLGGCLGGHLAAADGHRPGHDICAAAVRMRGLLGELVDGKGLAVQAAADRAHALVLHGQPFQFLDADPLVELEPAHVVGAEDLGAGDHLHAVLGLAEHPASGLAKGTLVDDHLAHVPDDVVGSLARGDAIQDGALDPACEFAVNVTGEREVVLRHEVEGIGVDDGEHLGGQLVDAFGLQIGVERQRRVGELSDSLLDTELEGVLGRLAKDQGLLPLEPLHGVVEFELELFQPLERGELVVRQGTEGAVLENGAGDLVFGLF